MAEEVSRLTVYLDKDIHKSLKLKAIQSSKSVSKLINQAIINELKEDLEDIKAIRQAEKEPILSYEEFLREMNLNERV